MQIIPNEDASLLMMLADLSVQRSYTGGFQISQDNEQQIPQRQPSPHPRQVTPTIKEEPNRHSSPMHTSPEKAAYISSQSMQNSPMDVSQPTVGQGTPRFLPNGSNVNKEGDSVKNTKPARFSTHRIMDILNDDQEVPVSRQREHHPPIQDMNNSSMRANISQHNAPSQSIFRVNDMVHAEDRPVDQALMDALGGTLPPPNSLPLSMSSHSQTWQRPNVGTPTESKDALRRRDPLLKLRDLLDKKSREHGREPLDRTQSEYWKTPEHTRFRGSFSGGFPEQERGGIIQYDPTRPSGGMYNPPSGSASTHAEAAQREAQDQGTHPWERDRRMSASQIPQQPAPSPYQVGGHQSYQSELNKRATSPPMVQSSYAAPPGTLPLPSKPSVPPQAGPINFRFAHYEPAPPRQSYPPTSPSYPTASHAPPGPPPSPYAPSYPMPPTYQSGYVPPPGSFQAPPPPPPPPPPSNMPPFPPLKIHQYGGQPILPANMAPPPQSGSSMTFVGQPAPPAAFSPQQTQLPAPHYEQRENTGERPAESQSRPRRQYRSYHAPGTQFRSYQGPGESRRRGG